MRVLIVDTYYPAFLTAHYARRPALAERSYDDQLQSLMGECFGTADAYSRHLIELGHEAVEIVANCQPLQWRWSEEHRDGSRAVRRLSRLLPGPARTLARRAVLESIALAQIESFDPQVVYVQDLWFFGERALEQIRRRGRLLVGQIASPPPPKPRLRWFDLITTSFPHYVQRFRRLGIASEYLKIAFYERVRERLRDRAIDSSVGATRPYATTFVGGVNPRVHARRTELLDRIAAKTDLAIWGYGAENLPPGSALLQHYRGEAWGFDMYEVLARSRITLNRHIDAADGYANNMRLFEATGVGALLLTEAAPNLGELFEPDREVVAYDGEDDLVEKVRHYLEHDEERRRIATAGQARTLREHTYARRIAELVDILEKHLQ